MKPITIVLLTLWLAISDCALASIAIKGNKATAPARVYTLEIGDNAVIVSKPVRRIRVTSVERRFYDRFTPLVEQIELETGIEASAIIAQSAHETGFGRSWLATQKNNFFGIKADGRWSGPRVWYHGSYYRVYKTPEDSFRDWVSFVGQRRYRGAMAVRGDPYKFITRLAASGYCPDDEYARLVIRIIKRHET